MISSYPLRALGEMTVNHDAQRVPVKAADRKPGPYPYYGAQRIVDYVDDYIFDGVFLLVAEDGENLRSRNEDIAFMASGKFWVNNHAHILRANSDAVTRFLNYAINSSDISGYITGSTIPKLSQRSLRSILIPCPPLAAQEEIVSLLGALDDKIELNRRMNETLEALTRAIFKDWFVDFGPTRAKMEGRAPYLAPELWELFPDALDDEGKPVGWQWASMGTKIETRLGGTPTRKKPEFWAGDIPWINSGKVNEFRVISPTEFITIQGFNNSATKLLPKRTTLIAITGATLGQVSLNEIEVCANQSIVGVVSNDKMPGEFLYLWVIENIGDLLATQTGAAQQHVNKGNINDLNLLCPSRSVMDAWIEIARPIFDQIAVLCFESETLAQTRDLLLPKLMSGEIRLRDAEKVVEAIA